MSYKVQNLTKQQIITSLLPIEFYDSFNFCQENKATIETKIFQKLNYIAKSLLTRFVDEKKKQFLFILESDKKVEEDEDNQFFQNTSKELLIKLYIETLKSLFPKSDLYFPNMIKKGVLYVRSQTLKIWRERVLELNYNDRIFSISKIAQKKKNDKNLDLSTYSIKWVGKVKGRFSFRLDSLSSKNKYKNFRISSELLEIAIEWHESLKSTMLPQLTIASYEELKSKYQDVYSGKEKEENVGFSDDIEGLRKEDKKSTWSSLFSKKQPKAKGVNQKSAEPQIRTVKSVDRKINEKDSNDLTKSSITTFEAIPKNSENLSNNLSKSTINVLEVPQTKVINATDSSKDLNLNLQTNIKEIKIKTEAEKLALKKDETNEEEKVKEIYDKVIKKDEEIYHEESDYMIKQENIFNSINRKKSCPNLVQDIVCNMDKEDLVSELDYSMLQSFENFRLLQNNIDQSKYKIFIKVNSPWNDVVKSFMDPLKYKLLNREIAELKILSIIQYNKSYIIYEKRKAYGRLYLPREFVYIRYMYEIKNSLILVDRSIDYSDIPHSYFSPTIRGTIISNVTYISKNPLGTISICLNICGSNNGAVSSSQDHDINYTYLKEFKSIEGRFSRSQDKTQTQDLEENKIEERMISFQNTTPLLDEVGIRKKTKYLNNLDLDNKDKIMAGLLLKEESSEDNGKSKKRSTSMDNLATIKDEKINFLEEKKNEETEAEQEFVQRNREISFSCQKSAEMLSELIESRLHISKCITNRHNTNFRQIKHPRFQYCNEIEGHYILKRCDWISNKSGGFIYHNQKVLDVQKKILGYLLKRMGTNLVQGKSIMSISLPIELFEKKSHLEILANNCTFAPHFFNKANDSESVLEQMKQTITFFLTFLHMATAQLKPFNPILGETFQGSINGMPIYLEQISHHPPISSLLLYGSQFRLAGNYEAHASLNANSCVVSILGSPKVTFKNGTTVYTSIPSANIGGTSFGQRTFNYEGKAFAYEPNHMLVCEMTFNPDKKGLVGGLFSKQQNPSDYFSGAIYQVNANCIKKIQKSKVLNKYEGLNVKEDVVKELCKVTGIWHKFIDFGGEKYWEFGKLDAYELEYERNPLPSDSIYREDIISWKSDDLQKSQLVKEKIENMQRDDKKLREKMSKNKKKINKH